MIIKPIFLVTIILVFTILMGLSACAPKAQPTIPVKPETTSGSTTIDGMTLLNDRCTRCHNLDRVINLKESQSGWDRIINKMIGKGAVLNPDQKNILFDYLTQNYGN